jgi:NAD(P)H dehydrogenase (quinone)
MRVLIVYAHPNANSFNHAMLENMTEGLQEESHQVRVKDLYAEEFDPVLRASDLEILQQGKIPDSILVEQESLLWAEGLVFIYPLWWFGRPAILKGWFDKVLTNGFAFEYGDDGLTGLLQHRRALALITAGGTKAFFKKNKAEPLVHRPMTDGTLAFCGIEEVHHRIYYDIAGMGDQGRKNVLVEVTNLGKCFNEA